MSVNYRYKTIFSYAVCVYIIVIARTEAVKGQKQFFLYLSDKVAVVKNVRLIPKQTIYFSQVHSVWTTGRGKGGGEFSGQVCRDRLYWVTTITSSRITTPDLTSYLATDYSIWFSV